MGHICEQQTETFFVRRHYLHGPFLIWSFSMKIIIPEGISTCAKLPDETCFETRLESTLPFLLDKLSPTMLMEYIL